MSAGREARTLPRLRLLHRAERGCPSLAVRAVRALEVGVCVWAFVVQVWNFPPTCGLFRIWRDLSSLSFWGRLSDFQLTVRSLTGQSPKDPLEERQPHAENAETRRTATAGSRGDRGGRGETSDSRLTRRRGDAENCLRGRSARHYELGRLLENYLGMLPVAS